MWAVLPYTVLQRQRNVRYSAGAEYAGSKLDPPCNFGSEYRGIGKRPGATGKKEKIKLTTTCTYLSVRHFITVYIYC